MSETSVLDRTDVDRPRRSLRRSLLLPAVGVWIGMVVVAILNATVRELFVTPSVGDYPAHVISTLTLLAALAVVAYLYFGRAPAHTDRELVAVGVLWAGATVAFELLFGHYVAGESWASLFGQYDLTAGMVWAFVPLFLLVAPLVIGRSLRQ